MQLTQRQIHLGLFVLMTIGSTLLLIFVLATPGALLLSRIIASGLVVGFGSLLFAYRRGWEYARPIAVILVTLLMGAGIPHENVTQQQTWAALIPPVVALLLTEPAWVLGSAIAIMSVILVRAGGSGVYTSPIELTLYVVIVGGVNYCHVNATACASLPNESDVDTIGWLRSPPVGDVPPPAWYLAAMLRAALRSALRRKPQ